MRRIAATRLAAPARLAAAVLLAFAVAACTSASARVDPPSVALSGPSVAPSGPSSPSRPNTATQRWDHVVVVVEENHSYAQIAGAKDAPYLDRLASGGTSFTHSFGVTHPSQPNYLALYSGSTRGVIDDSCPHTFATENLGHQLLRRGLTFVGYSEGLPAAGSPVCADGRYARKHAPWTDFSDLPARVNQPFTAFRATHYAQLPSVSFVIPDLDHDMHDGTVAAADTWLQSNLGGYATWARTHRSILIVTWDEDDDTTTNQIPTIVVGDGVAAQKNGQHITHYNLLRTLEDGFGLSPLGVAATAAGIKALGG